MEINIKATSRWFIFYRDQLLLEKQNGNYTIPLQRESPVTIPENTSIHTITTLNNVSCITFSIDHPIVDSDKYIMISLRTSYDYLEKSLYKVAGKAFQIIHWDNDSKYCSICGNKTIQTTSISKQCPSCGKEIYPIISTAILVLIRKENTILLVHARNFKGTFNSLVAGFLEAGETLEECVSREVLEETGLTIKNINYFGNQPWPYPSGLMVGFIADYESGILHLQDEELSSGAFYTKDKLPELPRKLSLARKMIDWWINQ